MKTEVSCGEQRSFFGKKGDFLSPGKVSPNSNIDVNNAKERTDSSVFVKKRKVSIQIEHDDEKILKQKFSQQKKDHKFDLKLHPISCKTLRATESFSASSE